MSQRMVHCVKLNKESVGLAEPPFAGELGREIYERVSAEAWNQWKDDLMIKIINEYRLDLSDNEQYNILLEQMRSFLNLGSNAQVLEVENAKRGQMGN